MPIGRYICCAGTLLLALLFVANWYLPKSAPDSSGKTDIDKPVIRITSAQKPPERIVIDTSQPTIVPPTEMAINTVPVEHSPQESYAQVSAGPPPPVVKVVKAYKKPQVVANRETAKKLAAYRPASPGDVAPVSGNSVHTATPLTQMSFLDVIKARLVTNFFGLH